MGIGLDPFTILSGSGFDVSSLVQQLLANKSGPLQEWQSEQTTLSTQAGLLLGINNNLTNLNTAVQALADPFGVLASVAATSSQPDVLTATAQSSATAGVHQITVTNPATSSVAYTDPVPNGVLTAGSLSIQVGSGGASSVPITDGETLDQLASDINNASLGVTANVITDANGSRLSLLSGTSGQPGSLTIVPSGAAGTPSYSGTGDGTISNLTGGPSSVAETFTIAATDATHFTVIGSVSGAIGTATVGTPFTSDQIGFTISQGGTDFQAGDTFTVSTTPPPLTFHATAGTNAALTVDGIPISSTSNTVTGVIPGVTLNLTGIPSATPVQLTVGPDTTQVTQAINNFVSAYNTVISSINQQYVVDPTNNTEGPLGSDFSLRSLQSSLLNDVAYSITGNSGVVNLPSLGISLNNDGTLSINTTATTDGPALADVLATDPGAVQNFFENASQTGFAQKFQADLRGLTDSVTGILNTDIAQNSAQQQALSTSISNLQTQLAAEQQQLTKQYSQVNASLQSYPLLLQTITEVIGSLTAPSATGQTFTPTLTKGL
jgi:flagellar hook-associated protein 2